MVKAGFYVYQDVICRQAHPEPRELSEFPTNRLMLALSVGQVQRVSQEEQRAQGADPE